MQRQWLGSLVIIGIASHVLAMPPARYNWQGRVTGSGGSALQGNHTLFFSLYRGGDSVTSNSGSLQFKESASVSLLNGVGSHAIGTGTNLFGGPLTDDMLRTDSDTFLQVGVDTESNVMIPRTRLETVPYASLAKNGEVRIPLDGPLPITIAQPGSYYLTTRLSTTATQTGISITADNVTLDLNGYTLSGPGVAGIGNAINISTSVKYVTIRNGFIQYWFTNGVVFNASGNVGCSVEDITASEIGNGASGQAAISVNSSGVSILRCKTINNNAGGVSASGGAIITDTLASGNTKSGITASRSVISNCIAKDNVFFGFSVSESRLSDCIARTNGGGGVSLTDNCILDGVLAFSNGGFGFSRSPLAGGSRNNIKFHNCVATSNSLEGFGVEIGCTLENCESKDNSSTGIVVGATCLVRDCLIVGNDTGGIQLVTDTFGRATDTTIENNVLGNNTGTEINATTGTRIIRNSIRGNLANSGTATGVGIRAEAECHIEGNTVNNKSTGIQTLGACLVIGNSASGNSTNYSLTSGTNGPIVNSGNISTNTNPSANYSY